MAVSDSKATYDKISLESSDLILVSQPYCLCYLYYDTSLSDKFSYLAFKIYYGRGALLCTFVHYLIHCSRQCSEVGVLPLI